jgi:hypothetical protein
MPMKLLSRSRPAADPEPEWELSAAQKAALDKWDGEMPVLEFLIYAVCFGVPIVIVFVIFLAALRILGWL